MRIAHLAGLFALTLIGSGLVPLPARAAIAAVPFDFDGNGYADLATGIPGESVGSVRQAGAVQVIYASVDGLTASGTQLWSRASAGVDGDPTKGEQLGRSLTSADFDGDGYADLAALTCNQIAILHGSPTGLSSRSVLMTAPLTDPPPCSRDSDTAGLSGVVAGDFNGDSQIDLVAGSSGSNRVFVYPGTDTGFGATPALDFAKDPPTRKNEVYTEVGNSLAAGDITGDGIDDLVVGTGLGLIDSTATGTSSVGGFYFVPGSRTGLQPDRRHFFRSYGNKDLRPKKARLSDAFGHALVIADFDRDGFGDVAVGDPESGFDQDCEGEPCSGAVLILRGSANGPTARGRQYWSLSAQRPWDGDEAVPEGNNFGARLAAGDLNRDGHLDLAIAAPNDQSHYGSPKPRGVGSGNVYVLYGTSRGLSRAGLQVWSQWTPGVVGVAKPWEQFGLGGLQILDAGRGRAADLLVHNPHDRSRRGSVSVLYGSDGGLRARSSQLWHQDTPGVPGHGEHPIHDDALSGDQFGTAGPPDPWL